MFAQTTPMTAEIALWVFGISLVPLIAWCFTMTMWLLSLRRDSAKLIHMHEHADEFGFGTVSLQQQQVEERAEMRNLIRDNTQAMREVAHYIKWCIEHQTGEKPPPPVPQVMEG